MFELVEKIKSPIITSVSVVSSNNNPNFQPTIPQPFNLTKPTIRPLPKPTYKCEYRPVILHISTGNSPSDVHFSFKKKPSYTS